MTVNAKTGFLPKYRGVKASGARFAILLTLAVNAVLFGALGWINARAAKPSPRSELALRKTVPAPKRIEPRPAPKLHRRPEAMMPEPEIRVRQVRRPPLPPRQPPQVRRLPLPKLDLDLRQAALPTAGQLVLPALGPGLSDADPSGQSESAAGIETSYALPEVDQPPRRIRSVEPAYPVAARRRGLSGWVKLGFTVKADGSVADVRVLDASTRRVFDRAAIQAIRRWMFEPGKKDGEAVPVRCQIRMEFRFDQ